MYAIPFLHQIVHSATDYLVASLKEIHLKRQQQSWESFLQHQGGQLLGIELLCYTEEPFAKLPCPNLRRLRLSGGAAQLGPAHGLPGVCLVVV